MEKNELEAALKESRMSFGDRKSPHASQIQNRDSSSVSDVSPNFIVTFTLYVIKVMLIMIVFFSSLFLGLVNWVTVARSFQKFSRKRRHGNILTEDE